MEAYELKSENLLSYEQFQQILAREKLQVSLLFTSSWPSAPRPAEGSPTCASASP